MALVEAALEELGLAPAWVRRGFARVEGVQQDAATAEHGAAAATQAVSDAAHGAARESAPREKARDVARAAGAATVPAAEPTRAAAHTSDAAEPASAVGGRSVRAPLAADAHVQEVATDADARAMAASSGQSAQGAQNSMAEHAAPVEQPAARAARREPTRGGSPDSAGFPQDAGAPSAAANASAASAHAPSARADGPGAAEPDDDTSWFDLEPVFEPALPDVAAKRAAAPAPSVAAELGWDELRARVADCQRCRLCEKRTNTVFGVGDENADWMLVGEAPGENEDKQGEPFVGQAGKLLDNMLRALALKRGEDVYIANVIKCRPPGNRNPEPDEVARCEPYLQRQVALVKPKLIVALGRFAAQTLLKTDASIASMRGRVHQYEGVPVIVTYHPAYLLRSLQDKAKAWSDLCLANDTYRNAAPAADPQ
ncbi:MULTISPECIES: uracil-DNA glycosylase [Burkholderia]|uniref:Type-4 uracil-DNA glycosylase n=1 Tax=Burkholderia mayonis TaxID=1385591 RepID=A0A1B4FD10_9BURK|nr:MULTISPECIES: uracil-DNA glycosylase [Burkholderia]AOJ01559.1 DNA polymerase [Burkholderia mayonis]KVE42233.1 DNA polymerase [Burkholderia sp. BDU5]KVE49141.1 DNA polymerase [Burkholderia mayonis]